MKLFSLVCTYKFYLYHLMISIMGLPWWLSVRIHLPMQETWVPSLSWDGPLEKEVGTHSSTLAWEIPWTEEPGGLQSMGLQRVRVNLATKQQ